MRETRQGFCPTPACMAVIIGIAWMFPLCAQEKLPADVAAFIEQRTLCDHFRGEPWPEGNTGEERERREFLTKQMKRYCTGTDKRLRLLRKRYRDNEEVSGRLQRFESSIETK